MIESEVPQGPALIILIIRNISSTEFRSSRAALCLSIIRDAALRPFQSMNTSAPGRCHT